VIREELEVQCQQGFLFGFELVFEIVQAPIDGGAEAAEIPVVLVAQAFLFREFPHPLYQVEIGAVARIPH
jgi:hypothetical protein